MFTGCCCKRGAAQATRSSIRDLSAKLEGISCNWSAVASDNKYRSSMSRLQLIKLSHDHDQLLRRGLEYAIDQTL